MVLLTVRHLALFRKYGCQDWKSLDEVQVIVKFFHPFISRTRYATEFDAETGLFFGIVDGDFVEWGSFSLDEFQQPIRWLPFERELYFEPCSAKKVLDMLEKERGGFM